MQKKKQKQSSWCESFIVFDSLKDGKTLRLKTAKIYDADGNIIKVFKNWLDLIYQEVILSF